MALNDVHRSSKDVPVAKKLISAAAAETVFELDGATSGGVPLTPCQAITFSTRGGNDMKLAMRAGDIAAGNYKTLVGGAAHTVQRFWNTKVYVAVTPADDTVEAIAQ
jgi:hypothetical protein